ncbi:MAG: bifunctional folylpolyglutamate synthase/dihydrofolate synthase [Firmicutes bacterium]|nr:bifunctional folylpolyglutamate synthase/dihydrofolate synthase [Bacillota bacterium]
MNYKESEEYIENLERFGIRLGLSRIGAILKELGNPHLSFKAIHVAGTNGKGSTVMMLSRILRAHGFKTGSYYSPHLHKLTERIRFNNKPVLRNDFAYFATLVREKSRKIPHLTQFEFLTAMAFAFFSREKAEWAVVETGLGGKYDATNVLNPELSIITNISLDHTDRLGSTVEEIALDKAGIIKKKGILVTGERNPAVRRILKAQAGKKSSLFFTSEPFNIQQRSFHSQKIKIGRIVYDLSLLGDFQAENLSVVFKALEALGFRGNKFEYRKIRPALQDIKMAGRMEIIRKAPLVIADGAHNPEGARNFRISLQSLIKNNCRIWMILGILADKDANGILKELLPLADIVIATSSRNSRALMPEKLAAKISGKKTFIKESVPEAVKFAVESAGKNDVVIITGSLYTVAEARKYLLLSSR